MAVGPSRCCRGVVVDCGQTSNKITLNGTDISSRWKRSRGLSVTLPIATSLTPTNTTPPHDHRSSTTRSSTTSPFFTQIVMFDNYRLHPTHSSTTSPAAKVRQLYTYNSRQQHPVELRHTCVFRLISPSHRFFSFHPVQTWYVLLIVTIRYVTPYCNQNYNLLQC